MSNSQLLQPDQLVKRPCDVYEVPGVIIRNSQLSDDCGLVKMKTQHAKVKNETRTAIANTK